MTFTKITSKSFNLTVNTPPQGFSLSNIKFGLMINGLLKNTGQEPSTAPITILPTDVLIAKINFTATGSGQAKGETYVNGNLVGQKIMDIPKSGDYGMLVPINYKWVAGNTYAIQVKLEESS